MTLGHVNRQLQWTCIYVPLMLIAMFFGSWFDRVGMAVAVSAFHLVIKLPAIWWATKDTVVSVTDFLAVTVPPIIICLIAAAISWVICLPLEGVTLLIAKSVSYAILLPLVASRFSIWKSLRGDVVFIFEKLKGKRAAQ